MTNALGRNSYHSSGNVAWLRFIPLAVLTWVTASLMALLLFFLFRNGYYYIVVAPLIASLPVAGMMVLAVLKGKCRSPLAAGVVGAVAGLVLYLGYYYVDMVNVVGPRANGRLDLLPKYIAWRMGTDVTGESYTPNDAKTRKRTPGQTAMNWFGFTMEFGVVMVVSVGAGLMRARRAFCERCGDWMKQEIRGFAPGGGARLVQALQSRSPQTLAALTQEPTVAIQPSVPCTAVAIEFCPSKLGRPAECPVYFSVREITKGAGSFGLIEAPGRQFLVHRNELAREEITALTPLFPMLQEITGKPPAEAMRQLGVAPPVPRGEGEGVSVIPVPAPFANKLLTRKMIGINNALAFVPLLVMFGGIGICAGGAIFFPDSNSPEPAAVWKIAAGVVLIGTGIVLVAGGAITGLLNTGFLANRYMRSFARTEFAHRPGRLVDLESNETFFVEVEPRENRNKLMLETAADLGFLAVDRGRAEVLFDGDRECYRIPAAAIISCTVEKVILGGGEHSKTVYSTVLRAHRDSTVWEVPFNIRHTDWNVSVKKRLARAVEVCDAIRSILPPQLTPGA